MSEILVCLVDRSAPDDPARDALLLKRGDAIVSCPDGWPWSEAERSHPGWAILALPGVSDAEASTLLAPGRAAPGSGKLPTARAFRLDLDALPADPSTVDGRALASLLVARPNPPDPRHPGDEPRKVG